MWHIVVNSKESASDLLFFAHRLYLHLANCRCSMSIGCNCILFTWPNLLVLLGHQWLRSFHLLRSQHFRFQDCLLPLSIFYAALTTVRCCSPSLHNTSFHISLGQRTTGFMELRSWYRLWRNSSHLNKKITYRCHVLFSRPHYRSE